MSTYHLRVDSVDDNEKVNRFVEKFQNEFSKLLVYHEISTKTTKPHYHIHIQYIKEHVKKDEDRYRKAYSRFFEVKGSEYSYSKDKGKSEVYTVKDRNKRYTIGYTDDEIEILYKMSYRKKTDTQEPKSGIKSGSKQKQQEAPLLKMYKWFIEQLEADWKRYNYEHIRDYDIVEFLQYQNEQRYIALKVMKWYGVHANKAFMYKKMAECADYIRYKFQYDYNNVNLHQTDELMVSQILQYMA